jgi:hypothetical protein
VTGDGGDVVYRARETAKDDIALYRASLVSAEAPQRLTAGLPLGTNVQSHGITLADDDRRVVFLAGETGARSARLLSVPVAGGPLADLAASLGAGVSVDPLGILLTPDSRRVIFRATSAGSAQTGLYIAPVDGSSSAVSLAGELAAGEGVLSAGLRLAGDDAVVFLRQNAAGDRSLWAAELSGGTAARFLAGSTPGARIAPSHVAVSAADGAAFYVEETVEQVRHGKERVNEHTRQLMMIPLAGGQPTPLLAPTPFLRGVIPVDGSGRVLVLADLETKGKIELFAVPLAGGAPLRLSPDMPRHSQVLSAAVAPDSSTVIFLADAEDTGRVELFQVSTIGGEVARLNGELADGGSVYTAAFGPDGTWVVYTAEENDEAVIELMRAPLVHQPSSAASGRMAGNE